MLEEHRVAAHRRVEQPESEDALSRDEDNRDGHDRGAEHLDEAGGVERPHEEREAEPRQARGTHPVDGDHEVQAGEDAREPVDEDTERRRDDRTGRRDRAEGRVERPARVETARHNRPQRQDGPEGVDIEAEEVQLRERDVLRPEHQRQQEVAE